MSNKYLDKVASTRFVREVLALEGKSLALPGTHSILKSVLSSKSHLSQNQLSQMKGNIRLATPSNARAYHRYANGDRLRRLPTTLTKFVKQPMLSDRNMHYQAIKGRGLSEYTPVDILERWAGPARDNHIHPSELRHNFSNRLGRSFWVAPRPGLHDGYGTRSILDVLGTGSLAKLPK